MSLIMNLANAQTETKIIAHRGAWKEFNLPENSIASLQKAIQLNCYGSEFDVRSTKDGILVVNHDPAHFGDTIELNTYADLNKNKLSNGEDLPTLAAYFSAGTNKKHNTLLICEIKQAVTNKDLDYKTTIETLALAKKMGIENRIVYISFSFEILQTIKKINPTATVLYLEADQSIATIKNANFDGINYNYKSYLADQTIVANALSNKLKVGSWTVNLIEDLQLLQAQGVTLITTNQPQAFLNTLVQH